MNRILTILGVLLLGGCGYDTAGTPPVDVHGLAERGQTGALLQAIVATEVDARDVCYRTPLMLAAQYGHLDTVNQLLAAGARVSLHEKGNYSALMLAAGNGHADVVRALAAAGAAVDDAELSRGWTALVWSAKRGHVATVRELLALGADPAHRDRQGRSARDWAAANGHRQVVELLDLERGTLASAR